ncbi:MAG TPA: hypothetical protein VHE12_02360 [bacterium]|nr:hypothetical protein [bacterium]
MERQTPVAGPKKSEKTRQKDMRHQRKVQSQGESHPSSWPKQGIKKRRLEISQERGATKIVGIPKWKMALSKLFQGKLTPDRKMQEKIVLFA